TPFLADMVSAVFSPFNIFSYVGDLKRSFAWSALCRLIVAGVGTYYLCRLLAVSRIGALLAAISFMLCAFQVVWLNHPQTNVSILLPWALVAVEKIVTAGDRLSVLLQAGVVAGLLLGGHPETALHVALGSGIFFLYRLGQQWKAGSSARTLWSLLARVGGGALLGLGLAAVVVIPFAELLWQSGIWEVRGGFPRNPFVLPPSMSLTALAPDLFGNPLRGTDYGPKGYNYNERTAYAGLLPLLLTLLALWRCRHDWRARFLLGLGLFCLAIVLGLWPVFDLVTALPIFHHTPNHRLLFLWQFCVAVLAGVAADDVIRSEQKRQTVVPNSFLMLAGVLSLLPIFLWLVPQLGLVKQNHRTLYGALYPLDVGGLAVGLFVLCRTGKISASVW
ncbi:MAG: YfhO family protein, partial [Candidatus Binatia bacterium]